MFYRSDQSCYRAYPDQAADASRAYYGLSQSTLMYVYTYTMLQLINMIVESLYASPEESYL